MSAIVIAALQVVAPGLLGGALGSLLGVLQMPGIGAVLKVGKKMANGDHLSEEDKEYIHKYNQAHGTGPGGDAYSVMNRW